MFKSGETSHKAIGVLLLVVLVIGLALILESRPLIPQAPAGGITYPPPATEQIRAPVSPTQEVDSQTPYPPPSDQFSRSIQVKATEEAIIAQAPCIFAGEPVNADEKVYSIDDFTFSKPQIILTQTENINLVSWLPDNQQVLITRYIEKPEATAKDQIRFRDQIELLDINSGKSIVLADRNGFQNTQPVWLPALHAAYFVEFYRPDPEQEGIVKRRLRASLGDPAKTELIADNLPGSAVAANPSKDQIVYLASDGLRLLRYAAKENRPVGLKARLKNGEEKQFALTGMRYEAAWRPNSDQVIFYKKDAAESSNRIFFMDLTTGNTCRVEIRNWAGEIRWSPNGRYFAILQLFGSPGHTSGSNLIVYDMQTGQIDTTEFPLPEGVGTGFLTDIAWAPDNRHLAMIVDYSYAQSDSYKDMSQLILLDFIQNKKKLIQSQYEFGGGAAGTNLLWSPDGTMLLASCPTEKAERLCLISVKTPAIPPE